MKRVAKSRIDARSTDVPFDLERREPRQDRVRQPALLLRGYEPDVGQAIHDRLDEVLIDLDVRASHHIIIHLKV